MKKYVFIGTYDKTDMLIYISKMLTLLDKKVLLVDTTILKKTRYVVPTMIHENKYITNFEGIDIAIGFENLEAIRKYQIDTIGQATEYDIAILDIDRAIAYQKFNITNDDLHYFVTSFDVYNLKRGIQILPYINQNAKITKIYFTAEMSKEEDEYLNYLAKDYKINWEKNNIVLFPYTTEDLNAIFINQRTGKIQMKGLSSLYVESILFLVEEISGESNLKIKKIYKRLVE